MEYAGMGTYEIEEWLTDGWYTLRFFHTKEEALKDIKRMKKQGRKVRIAK